MGVLPPIRTHCARVGAYFAEKCVSDCSGWVSEIHAASGMKSQEPFFLGFFEPSVCFLVFPEALG